MRRAQQKVSRGEMAALEENEAFLPCVLPKVLVDIYLTWQWRECQCNAMQLQEAT